MSDFLGRIAARAVGQATVARPRARPFFAQAEPAGADVGLELVETEVSKPGAVPRGAPDASRAEPTASAGPRTSSLETEPGGEVAAPPRSQPVAPLAPAIARFDDRDSGTDATRRVSEDPDAAPHEAAPATTAPAATPAVVPSVAVAAIAATPVEAPRSAQEAADVTRAEPPPVRVHIGRLEIRANVQEPRPQLPRRESARTEDLSLADYLRGRRDVG